MKSRINYKRPGNGVPMPRSKSRRIRKKWLRRHMAGQSYDRNMGLMLRLLYRQMAEMYHGETPLWGKLKRNFDFTGEVFAERVEFGAK